MADALGPAWGYKPDGAARIFDDGILPKGWSADPLVIKDETKRTAEWLSGIRPASEPAPTPPAPPPSE